jgi:NAD(P)-dependent dehydrogenase (short-subunit alcohol dehydrogenase family)
MRSVVITGTSTGIGWGAAKVLIANSFRVFGSVRKRADADRLKAEFGQSYVPLLFDVTDAGAVNEAAAEVRAALAGETLAGLVNNAGVAVAGPLLELPVEEFRRQVEINLVGVVIVTKRSRRFSAPIAGSRAIPAGLSTSARSADASVIHSWRPTLPRSSRSKVCRRV